MALVLYPNARIVLRFFYFRVPNLPCWYDILKNLCSIKQIGFTLNPNFHSLIGSIIHKIDMWFPFVSQSPFQPHLNRRHSSTNERDRFGSNAGRFDPFSETRAENLPSAWIARAHKKINSLRARLARVLHARRNSLDPRRVMRVCLSKKIPILFYILCQINIIIIFSDYFGINLE